MTTHLKRSLHVASSMGGIFKQNLCIKTMLIQISILLFPIIHIKNTQFANKDKIL